MSLMFKLIPSILYLLDTKKLNKNEWMQTKKQNKKSFCSAAILLEQRAIIVI